MIDYREQIQGQAVATEGKVSLWTISLDKGELFNETSARSMYFVKLNSKEPVTSDSNVILDDDRNLYNVFMENAVQELLTVLARRIPQSVDEYKALFAEDVKSPITNDDSKFGIYLVMGENHDANLINALKIHCKEFLIRKTLEQWYNADFGSMSKRDNVAHILHYRRKSSARRVRPLL